MSRSFKPLTTWSQHNTAGFSLVASDHDNTYGMQVNNGKHFWKRRMAKQARQRAKHEIEEIMTDHEEASLAEQEELDEEQAEQDYYDALFDLYDDFPFEDDEIISDDEWEHGFDAFEPMEEEDPWDGIDATAWAYLNINDDNE